MTMMMMMLAMMMMMMMMMMMIIMMMMMITMMMMMITMMMMMISLSGGSIGDVFVTWEVDKLKSGAEQGRDFLADGAQLFFPFGAKERSKIFLTKQNKTKPLYDWTHDHIDRWSDPFTVI